MKEKINRTENITTKQSLKTPGEVLGECLQWLCSPRGGNNYFGRVMSICSRQEIYGLNGAGVRLDIKGNYIYGWDPDWFMLHSRAFQLMVLVHEAAHLVFNHIGAMIKQVKDIEDPNKRHRWWEVMNIAADMAANDVSLRNMVEDPNKTFKEHKDELIWPESNHYDKGKTFEHYLKRLLEDLKADGYSPNDEPPVIHLKCNADGTVSLPNSNSGSDSDSDSDSDSNQNSSSSSDSNSNQNSSSSSDSNSNQNSSSSSDSSSNQESNSNSNSSSNDNKPQWFKDLQNKVTYSIDVTELMNQMTNSEIERAITRSKATAAKIATQAAKETKKARGTVPGAVENEIAELLKEPTIPWKDVLRNMIKSGLANKMTDSLITPNSALLHLIEEDIEPYPGYQHELSTHIAIGVDTSGSVSDEEFIEFLSEIRGIIGTDNSITLMLIMFDHAMQDERRISNDTKSNELSVDKYASTRYGYGGTSFTPFLKYVCNVDEDTDWVKNAHREKEHPTSFDLAIIFTDGYAPVSIDKGGPIPTYLPKCPLIWAITPTGQIDEHMKPRVLKIID